jgi:hypothetical protein
MFQDYELGMVFRVPTLLLTVPLALWLMHRWAEADARAARRARRALGDSR